MSETLITTSGDDLLAADAKARRRALEPASFIVEAPAGAGKTELIAQRFLMLLARVEHPEEIVAITFTRKAAAEMRNRILASLEMAASGVLPEAVHRQVTFELARTVLARSAELGWALQSQPQRLRILTIDSLCASLARQMPLLSRFGAQPAVAQEAGALYAEAAAETVALLDEAALPCVAESLSWLDNDTARLQRLIAEMLARRDQWLHHALDESLAEASARVLKQLVDEELVEIAGRVDDSLQHELMPYARFAADQLGDGATLTCLRGWDAPLAPNAAALPMWRALCDLLLTGTNGLRRSLNKNNGFPATDEGRAAKQGLLELLDRLRDDSNFEAALARIRMLPDPALHADEGEVVEHFAALLKLAAAQLFAVFQRHGKVDFIEVSQRAIAALNDGSGPTELALKLDYRLSHLLVDEFQDTSPTQIRLLELLTTGWMPGDGRTLFCVGDPMQSIYRFRKADVGLFLQATQRGIGGVPLEALRLSRNNRSSPAVVDWVNQAFDAIFPPADQISRGTIRYRSFVATHEPLPSAGVAVHPLVLPAGTPAAERDRLEARRMLAIIDGVRADDPARSIAVLVRARSHLSSLIAEIRAHRPELRFSAVEVEALADRQWIADLMTLVRALSQRADRVAWLALLRAPWCGLILADLHALAADDRRSTICALMADEARVAALSDDGRARLAHVRKICEEAFAHAGRMPFGRWVESTWLRLGGPALLPDAAAGEDVEAWFGLLDRLVDSGEFSLERLEDEVGRLFAAADAGADGSLSFMTVHKSKGLEFDTVIVPGLHLRSGQTDTPLLRWEDVATGDGGSTLVVAPVRTRRNSPETTSTYAYLQKLEAERALNEELRVLYVAATRAVRALHWVGACEQADDGSLRQPTSGTPLRLLWPVFEPLFAASAVSDVPPADSHGLPSWEDFAPPLLRLRTPGELECIARAVEAVETETPGLEQEPADTAGRYRLEAAVGTLVHRYLEIFARTGCDGWTVGRLSSLRQAMVRWLGGEGFAEADADKGAARALSMLERVVASDTARWILVPREQAASELTLASRSETAIHLHVVDRSFVEDGVRWIIDFKTARLPDGADDAAFAEHAQRYRDQLDRYAALFRDEGLPVRCAIYYVEHDRLEHASAGTPWAG
ncbi:MAG TPA: UvrD-helicase domain-containing protein [Azoarcus taiwanensis]|nr:UvrD-helicase domain-containing protein [Azoarcus taiwanensis]